MSTEKKTADEWVKEMPKEYDMIILKWAGKDYLNEKITKHQFDKDFTISTISCDKSFFIDLLK